MKRFQYSRLGMAVSSLLLSSLALSVNANEQEESIERIEVTGSSIKRTDLEGSLPVTTISSTQIKNSGVTSVPDLIQQIPSMQGFTVAADSVGGSGGGTQTASLRDIGEAYTLVLLNGRRMAPSDSGGTVDLSSIPLAAIERVEILKDGASAVYGSDAIAGVVNFILKKDLTDTNISARVDKPMESGGASSSFSISTGFGDIGSDGYNVLFAYTRDEQKQLKSSERDFAKTGLIPFEYEGNSLVWQRTSANAIPANAYLRFLQYDDKGNVLRNEDGDIDYATRSFNPYRETNGQCAIKNAPSGTTCVYDFTETLEILPEETRDSFFAQAVVELGDSAEFYSSGLYSKVEQINRIAPYPTGAFTLPTDTQLVQENVIPHLSAEEIKNLDRVSVRWRTRPGGNRTTEWATTTAQLTAGIKGDIGDISYDVALSHGETEREENRLGGYPIEDQLMGLLESGEVNIFLPFDELSEQANTAVANAMYSGNWETTKTDMTTLEAKASMPVFELPAGEVYIAGGFDYRMQGYSRTTSQANKDEVVLFESATPEFDFERDMVGLFVETIVPLAEGLEMNAAMRYDEISAVTDNLSNSSAKVGEDQDDLTYKVSFSYRPSDEWLLRASVGRGFKAPSMREIAEPRIEFGVTSSAYSCPFGSGDPLAKLCFPESIQYDILREGNATLKPEKSEQVSVGFVYSPSSDFGVTLDWWKVNLEDQVRRPEASTVFGDPVRFRHMFAAHVDNGTGDDVLAVVRAPYNVGKSNNEGIDWSIDLANEFEWGGNLKTSVQGTHMLESEWLRVGTDNTYDTSLGRFGSDNEVTFRNIFNINNVLSHGDFTHAFNIKYRSGYKDQYFAGNNTRIRLAEDLGSRYQGGVQRHVPSYISVDYNTQYFISEELTVQFGINNLFDKQPPLTLRTGGAGHQVGYDPRYADVLGRTAYLSANYTF